ARHGRADRHRPRPDLARPAAGERRRRPAGHRYPARRPRSARAGGGRRPRERPATGAVGPDRLRRPGADRRAGPAGVPAGRLSSGYTGWPWTYRVSRVAPATAAGITSTAPNGTRKQTNTATPKPSDSQPYRRRIRRRWRSRSPRRANGIPVSSTTSAQPPTTPPRIGAATCPATGISPIRNTRIAISTEKASSRTASPTLRANSFHQGRLAVLPESPYRASTRWEMRS